MKTTGQKCGRQQSNAGVRQCSFCSKQLSKRQITQRQQFCCHPCFAKNKVGKKHTWGWKIGNALRGVPKTKEHAANAAKAKIGIKRPDLAGSKSKWWKGDKVGYYGLHDWIVTRKGKPQSCKHCNTKEKKMYHWANISGKYRRRLNDWVRLCVPCHSKMDRARK